MNPCNHSGCDRQDAMSCTIIGTTVEEDSIAYYCSDHAFANGFCTCCGGFCAGIGSFETGNGMCDTCASENAEDDDCMEDYF